MDQVAANRAKQCFLRAEELRAAAEDMRHAQSRASILRLAENYERMGEGFENASKTPQASGRRSSSRGVRRG
jgi:hypothetical protein